MQYKSRNGEMSKETLGPTLRTGKKQKALKFGKQNFGQLALALLPCSHEAFNSN